ncbi:MAG: hypothetical protein M1840_008049 [Geoglossum simile]|nr:MAG: hypothetical protein M1840_008049 [Geoglossum simile]
MHFPGAVAAMLLLLISLSVALPRGCYLCGYVTPKQLVQIGRATASCDGAKFPAECATADQAAPFISAAFGKFNIATSTEKAALIALIMSESGQFKSNFRHDVAGQGTRNMQMFRFNLEYALSFPELVPQVNAIRGGEGTPISAISPDGQNAIRDLVLPNRYSFGSAMWFYTVKCTDAVKKGVRAGGEAGFRDFLTICVGTKVSDTARVLYANAVATLVHDA